MQSVWICKRTISIKEKTFFLVHRPSEEFSLGLLAQLWWTYVLQEKLTPGLPSLLCLDTSKDWMIKCLDIETSSGDVRYTMRIFCVEIEKTVLT